MSIQQNISPVEWQDYIWYAVHKNGNVDYEFNDDQKETLFDKLNKKDVIEFGLLGNRLKTGFDRKTGVFNLAGKKYDPSVTLKGGTKLELEALQKNIVTFKLAHTTGMCMGGRFGNYSSAIDAYFFGWKAFSKENGLHLQILFGIPSAGNGTPFIGIKASSDKETDITVKNLKDRYQTIHLPEGKSVAVEFHFN